MKLRAVAFSARGSRLAAKLSRALDEECLCFAPEKYCLEKECIPLEGGLSHWTQTGFAQADGLIFVCAAGIAVRAIAPFVRSKTTDPAVVVLDEGGNFAISLLSGHLGGANELAERVARISGAMPVITTATDVNRLFAVDVFAKANRLVITDMTLAKEVSAALLAGRPVGFCSSLPVLDAMPSELGGEGARIGVAVTSNPQEKPFDRTLQLIPRRIDVGIGCRRGKDAQALEALLLETLCTFGLLPAQVNSVASIDLKKDEPGLLYVCQKYGLPFRTFSAEELMAVPGSFSESAFVENRTGVDCVCERAAVLASGGGLICHKRAKNGMTIALAKSEEGVYFG